MSILRDDEAGAYADLIARIADAPIYPTPAFLNFLGDVTPGAERVVLVEREGGRLIGALPLFVRDGRFGAVINSLPYYGSHGDCWIDPGIEKPARVERALIAALQAFAQSRQAAATIMVERLHRPTPSVAAEFFKPIDWRYAHVSQLSRGGGDALEQVLEQAGGKTRNQARKGLKAGFDISRSDDEADWRALHAEHAAGMARLGGLAKSWDAFAALRARFASAGACRLYVARRGGEFAAALLLLLHKPWVEYFTPVVAESSRADQPLSALIAHAMAETSVEGFAHWNWGGTWETQASVRHFKLGWGARETIYRYWGTVSERISDAAPGDLREAYPGFYTRPFHAVSFPGD